MIIHVSDEAAQDKQMLNLEQLLKLDYSDVIGMLIVIYFWVGKKQGGFIQESEFPKLEEVAKWQGAPGVFCSCLQSAGILKKTDNGFMLISESLRIAH